MEDMKDAKTEGVSLLSRAQPSPYGRKQALRSSLSQLTHSVVLGISNGKAGLPVGHIRMCSADKTVIVDRIKGENELLAKGQLLIADKSSLDEANPRPAAIVLIAPTIQSEARKIEKTVCAIDATV